MIKVCIIISNLGLGGAEISMFKILVALNKQFKFVVISLMEGGELANLIVNEGIELYQLDFRYNRFKSLFKLYQIIKFEKPEIVHSWMYHSDFFGGIVAKLNNVPKIIWNIRNTDLMSGISSSTRLIGIINAGLSYFIPHTIVVVSHSAKLKHISIGYCARKILVINNGYLKPSKLNNNEINLFKKNLGVTNSVLIGSVGRYNEYKDHETFINSCLILLRRYELPFNLMFIIIGRNVTNNKLSSLIKNENYRRKFIFLEEDSSIEKYYSIFDVFCLHSISEGFPNVLAEAMYNGCLCVSTDAGDARLILNDNRFIVPVKSPETLAKKINEILTLEIAEKNKIKYNNFYRIDSKYSLRIMKEKYINIYSYLK